MHSINLSNNGHIPMKVEAHCAWLQTCRPLFLGNGEHDSKYRARSYWFPTTSWLPLQGKAISLRAGQVTYPCVDRGTGCQSSMFLRPENLQSVLRWNLQRDGERVRGNE